LAIEPLAHIGHSLPMSEATAQDTSASAATWAGFIAMCLGMFMAILDVQVVVTSLNVIQDALVIGADRMSWVQTSYLIAEVIAIPLTGLLTRAFGMRSLFAVAVLLFTLASIGCAASSGFASLIALRTLQGLAAGVLIPLVFAAVFTLFSERQQTLATTLAGIVAVLAPTLGPITGGWITETWSWHWLFLINVAPGIAAALAAAAFLPRDSAYIRELAHLNWLSLAAMAIALASLQIALKQAPSDGWFSATVISLLAVTLMAGFLFIRIKRPVADISLFADKGFSAACFTSFILGMGLFGSVYLMPVFLAFVRGFGPLEIGTFMLVTGAAQLLVAPLAVAAEKRFDARLLTALGFAVFAVGLGMSAFDTRDTDFTDMILPQMLRGAAIMFCILPPTRLALGHLSVERVGDGSGVFNLLRNLGGAIGIALIDTVIFTRAPEFGEALLDRLKAGDPEAARLIGTTLAELPDLRDPFAQMTLITDIEQASMVAVTNEAWMMLAGLTVIALLALPWAGRERKHTSGI
jgi:DHA2 family multidrug resistance protein